MIEEAAIRLLKVPASYPILDCIHNVKLSNDGMAPLALLYIDDDDTAFFLLGIAVRETKNDVQLHRAANGDDALAFLRRAEPYPSAPRPDLIVLDLNLPGKSGIQVLSELKRDESLRQIPVVIFSSSSLSLSTRTSPWRLERRIISESRRT